MQYQKILEQLAMGLTPIIEFADGMNEVCFIDELPDVGMRAKLTGMNRTGNDEELRCVFDFSNHVVHNRSVAKANWRKNVDGRETFVTWFESGYYPENHIFEIYTGEPAIDDEFIMFTVLPFAQSQASTSDQLAKLEAIANNIGLYDAADYLKSLDDPTVAQRVETILDLCGGAQKIAFQYPDGNTSSAGIKSEITSPELLNARPSGLSTQNDVMVIHIGKKV